MSRFQYEGDRFCSKQMRIYLVELNEVHGLDIRDDALPLHISGWCADEK